MTIRKAFIVLLASLISLPAVAGPYADAMSACLADNTTGKERKDLARWIFVAMASHPEMRDLSNATQETRENTFKSVGQLVTRLLGENCASQTKAAMQKEGNESLKVAFESLGRLAMQELMSNKEVSASVSGFERYIDRKKVEAALSSR